MSCRGSHVDDDGEELVLGPCAVVRVPVYSAVLRVHNVWGHQVVPKLDTVLNLLFPPEVV